MKNKKIYTLVATGVILSSVFQQTPIKASALSPLEKSIESKGNTVNPDGTISNKDGSKTMVYGGCTKLKSGVDVVVPAGSIINENGSIQIPKYGDVTLYDYEVTVESGINGEAPIVNADGTVVVPKGANVETANGIIKVPEKSIVNPDGTILVKIDGEVQLTNGVKEIVPQGSTLNTWDPYQCIQIPSGKSVVLENEEEELTVTSKLNKEAITVSPDGSITVPDGGTVKTSKGEIILPSESILNTDRTISIQNTGSVKLPNGEEVNVSEGNVINLDGSLAVQDNYNDYWEDDNYWDDNYWYDDYYDDSYWEDDYYWN